MTLEEAVALLEALEYVGGVKNRIPDGLQLMKKYYDDVDVRAEHDEVWAGPDGADALQIERWSEEDIREMGRLGWHLDADIECWHHYT